MLLVSEWHFQTKVYIASTLDRMFFLEFIFSTGLKTLLQYFIIKLFKYITNLREFYSEPATPFTYFLECSINIFHHLFNHMFIHPSILSPIHLIFRKTSK